ncbi:MAG: glutamate ABC transporter substrate-binding protein [Actinomycetota bacterium]
MHCPTRWRWGLALAAVLALTAAACGGGGDGGGGGQTGGGAETQEFPEGSTMADLQEAGEIVIGVKYDVPPFGFKNPQTGEVEGFDVDLGKIIADELGVEPKFREAISDNRIPFLQDGTVDLILSTMTITTDRDVEVDFSRPYFVAHGRILVPEGSPIKGIKDLNGKKVCTGLGSTYEATIKEQAPDADLQLVESYSECYENIQNGAVDAVSTDDVILTGMVIQDDSLVLVGDQMTTEPYGAGVTNNDTEFQEYLDGVIEGTFEDGQWDKLYERWIGRYSDEPLEDHPEDFTSRDAYKLFPCDELCDQLNKR